MTKVDILQLPTMPGNMRYWAIANNKQSFGKTAGEALDSLTVQLGAEANTLIVVQNRQPDAFFAEDQQQHLAELMARWRTLRDQGQELSPEEHSQLAALIEAELHGSAERIADILDALDEA